MEGKKVLKKAKNIFTSLKANPESQAIGNRLLRKFKKCKQEEDSLLLKLNQPSDNNFIEEELLC